MKQNRRFAIIGEITQQTVGNFYEIFEHLDETKGPITIRICSEGGEISSGFAIYDRILQSKNQIITEGYGQVMSMAVLLFEAGNVRKISQSTRLMLHNAGAEIEGRMEHKDFRRTSKEMKVLEDVYNRAIAERAGVTIKQMEQWCDAETYFSAREAVANNLADIIIPADISHTVPKKKVTK